MSGDIAISSADGVDLTRHGVIEAHAGTGKTHTIVNLALRMIEQTESRGKGGGRYVHLGSVLLVTYTEKAAGELKKRIREGIAAQISKYRADREKHVLTAHLEDCLNNMHEAFIGTIHSVCLRLLQTWPFETGVHFDTAMIEDDGEGADAAMRASMRTDWEDAESGLPQGLKALEEKGVRLEKDKHIKLITATALKIMRGDGAELDDAPAGGMELEAATAKARDASDAESEDLTRKLLYAFINRAAKKLAARYDARKRENGLASYDDMLRLTRDAVRSRDGEMLKRLRKKLRYGIIDEFQDTSPIQWDIFRKIFLEDEDGAKIYIVGDPKQSIYSFQGADINSYISAKNAVAARNGTVYSLKNNFRSLPETIDGYNAVLCGGAENWFAPDGGGLDISYSKADAACPPPQRGAPPRPLPYKAVQAVALTEKTAEANRKLMAETTCAAIKKLIGAAVCIPKGLDWEEHVLDYSDFAVITETNGFASHFIEAFRKNGIPFVKYKMAGVFESPIARDLIALLSAIRRRHSPSRRVKALLTHFFNKDAASITPETYTDRCPDRFCSGDGLCIAHALDTWGTLADRQLWAQLFRSIIEKTGVRRRLIRLYDGERKLADLRQAADYCVSYLHSRNLSLERLITHLERLYAGEEAARDDKNIHTLATEKSSVKILTMHAAKGLEFPVVFLMNRDSPKNARCPDALTWTDADGKRRVTPCLSVKDLREGKGKNEKDLEPLERYRINQERERRRLLYVAMTRPQIALFAPMRVGENKGKTDGDITPRLTELLESGSASVEIFNAETFGEAVGRASRADVNDAPPPLDDIPTLSLQKFIAVETSYSQISAELKEAPRDGGLPAAADGDGGDGVLRNDESGGEDVKDDILPGGRATGDALHRAIDELMRLDDVNAAIGDGGTLREIVERRLKNGGILDLPSVSDPSAAVEKAAALIKTALTAPYPIPNGAGCAVLSAVPKSDRASEMEFLMSCDPKAGGEPWDRIVKTNNLTRAETPYRIRGFMDLVFRLKNDGGGAHPYRYYIVDWKSDTLESYDSESLRRHCAEQNYLLQSQIYSAALDKYLRGILGGRYDRELHFGGSLYVFLRGGAGVFLNDGNIFP